MTRLEELSAKFKANPKSLNKEELAEYVQKIRAEQLETRSAVRVNKRSGTVTRREIKHKEKPKSLAELFAQFKAQQGQQS